MEQLPDYAFTYITPIACPHCGGKSSLMRRSPVPDQAEGEVRTFVCAGCEKQTEIRVA